MSDTFDVLVNSPGGDNPGLHLVVDSSKRVLGGVGWNFQRIWAFPLYTPRGLTVLQEFPCDHPFHNGLFVGQHPVECEGRSANFWVAPPRRGLNDPLFVNVGRMRFEGVGIERHERGVRFQIRSVWLDEAERPLLNEVRRVDIYRAQDGNVMDVFSEKIASYGAVRLPKTKYGSISVRAEPRLLPICGGNVILTGGRRGLAAEMDAADSEYVAYESGGSDRFGLFLKMLPNHVRGAWLIRDYGFATSNMTAQQDVHIAKNQSSVCGLRAVAYDGALDDDRARNWMQ
ncbi:MAG TPA: DUF6807 family protein [Planctomycetota bacterium]|nr:DUF6807 family protein [Planctomycetota bacterium]